MTFKIRHSVECNVLATGSSGNATLIDGKILIDCGVPIKTVFPYIRCLKLVVLTHEHGDHFNKSTVAYLARMRPALRWACCPWMVQRLHDAGVSKRVIDVFEPGGGGGWYKFGWSVAAEEIPHNVKNCCWKLQHEDGCSVFYATDCGSLDGIEANGFDMYLVEANHTRAEIERRAAEKEAEGKYAYEVKAAEYHLSHEQAIDWLAKNMGPNSFWVPMHGHVERSKNDGT